MLGLKRREITQICILLMICGLLFFAGMDLRSLWEPDEARHSEMAREMLESGDWVTTRLNYVHYFEKPVFTFWLLAASFKIFGVSETSARLVPVVCATLTVLLVYFMGRRLWNGNAGLWSGICLATTLMYIGIAQIILVDMPLLLGVTLAIYGALVVRDGQGYGRYLCAIGAAIGFLSKGVLGIGLPGLMILCFIILSKEWGLLRQLLKLRVILFFLLLCAPWYVIMSIKNPEYFTYFWQDHVERLFTDRQSRWEPPYFYLGVLAVGFLPWIVMLPWALKQLWPGFRQLRLPANRACLWVCIWFFIFFLFFSISSSKMYHYALPMLPPFALIIGWGMSQFISYGLEGDNSLFLCRSLTVLVIILLICGISIPVALSFVRELVTFRAGLGGLILPLIMIVASLLIFIWRKRWWMAIVGPLAFALVVIICSGAVVNHFDNWRSVKGILKAVELDLRPTDKLVSYGDMYYGLSFYGQRRVVAVKRWGELEYGRANADDNAQWFLPKYDEMFNMMNSSRERVVVLCRLRDYAMLEEAAREVPGLKLFEWVKLDGKVLFSNHPR